MILVALLLAAKLTLSPFERSMAWADARFADCIELPCRYDRDIAAAMHAYESVVRKFGPSPRTGVGIARCLVRMGRPERAATILRALPPGAADPGELAAVSLTAEVTRLVKGQLPKGWILVRAAPVAGNARLWGALVGPAKVESFPFGELVTMKAAELRLYRHTETGRIDLLDRLELDDADTQSFDGGLIATSLEARTRPVLIAGRRYIGADYSPGSVDVVAVRGDRLRLLRSFGTVGGFDVHVLESGRPVIGAVAGWRVWWPDYYEWRGDRFVLANRSYPKYYRDEEREVRADLASMPPSFGNELRAAAIEMVNGRPARALSHLRRAERLCDGVVHPERFRGPGAPQLYDPPVYGDAAENLREIRLRIAWIERGDLDHALLYRALDFDLEIPPHRLGRAKDGVLQ